MKKILFVLALALTVAACKKETPEANYLTSVESVKEHILGKWESESRPIAGTPDSYEFTNDSIFTLITYPNYRRTRDAYSLRKNTYSHIDNEVYEIVVRHILSYGHNNTTNVSDTAYYNYGIILKLSDSELHTSYPFTPHEIGKYKRVQ